MKRITKQAFASGAIAIAGFLALGASPVVSEVKAQPAVEVQSYGAPYGEWAARWWQWALSIPVAFNPLLDATGNNCAESQYDTVWFLAGTLGGTAVNRECTVPAGKALFFPLINTVNFKPKGYETLLDLRALGAAFVATVQTLECTIDAVPCATDLFKFRAASPSFTIIAPSNGLLPPGQFKMPGNADPMVADGYWILLPALEPGEHTLKFGGATSDFVVDVTYTLTVVAPE